MNTDSREQGHDVDGRRGFAIGRPLGIWAGTKSLHKLRYATISLIVAALFVALVGDAMAQTAPTPTLGTAESFGVLGGSTVTDSGPTIVNGDLGVWPGTAVTGFLPGIVVPPGAIHAGDAAALQAQDDVTIAYVDLAGRACDTDLTGTGSGWTHPHIGRILFQLVGSIDGSPYPRYPGQPRCGLHFPDREHAHDCIQLVCCLCQWRTKL